MQSKKNGRTMGTEDYKYILDSLSLLQIGSRYTYRDLLDNIDVSYKYRCIIKQILLQEVDQDTTLESHLYYMKPEDESCRVYRQLKAKIRIYVPQTKKGFLGKVETPYEERTLSPEELASITPQQKEMMGIIVAELQLSKVGLLTFVV